MRKDQTNCERFTLEVPNRKGRLRRSSFGYAVDRSTGTLWLNHHLWRALYGEPPADWEQRAFWWQAGGLWVAQDHYRFTTPMLETLIEACASYDEPPTIMLLLVEVFPPEELARAKALEKTAPPPPAPAPKAEYQKRRRQLRRERQAEVSNG